MNTGPAPQRPVLRGGRVVIVGGGVVGLSIAYHLAARGYRDVTLVERRTLGSGTTANGTGGIRQQFSSPINVALSRRAVDYFVHFEERVGRAIHYRQHGYLFLFDCPEQLTTFRANVAMQQKAGVSVEILKTEEIAKSMPHVRLDGLVGASFCPTDGSARSRDVVGAFADRARRHGAQLLEGTVVTAMRRDTHGATCGVETTDGFIEAEVVINAAGPWAAEVGALCDLPLPIAPHRRQAFAVASLPWLTPEMPLTIDFGTGAYVHPGFDGAVIGGNDRDIDAGFDDEVDWSLVPSLKAALANRVPAMAKAVIIRGWAGLRDMTPDDHAIVGPVVTVPGFWLAAGFSGHGFMHSPVIGELLSEWLIDGAPSLDLAPLGFERFGHQKATAETAVF